VELSSSVIQLTSIFISYPFLPRQRDERVIVVWADQFDNIIPLFRDLEDKLIKLVWGNRHLMSPSSSRPGVSSTIVSDVDLSEKGIVNEEIPVTAKEQANARSQDKPKIKASKFWSWRTSSPVANQSDPEKDGLPNKDPRPVRLFAPFYCGLAVALSTCERQLGKFTYRSTRLTIVIFHLAVFIGSGVSILLAEWVLDNNYMRFALVVTTPFLFCVSLVSLLQGFYAFLSDLLFALVLLSSTHR